MCSGVQKRGIAAGILQKQGTSTTNASPEGSTALKNRESKICEYSFFTKISRIHEIYWILRKFSA
jgi:hypothetical protein